MSKLCPKCESLAHYNYHFQAYMCLKPGCDGMVQDGQVSCVRKFSDMKDRNRSNVDKAKGTPERAVCFG